MVKTILPNKMMTVTHFRVRKTIDINAIEIALGITTAMYKRPTKSLLVRWEATGRLILSKRKLAPPAIPMLMALIAMLINTSGLWGLVEGNVRLMKVCRTSWGNASKKGSQLDWEPIFKAIGPDSEDSIAANSTINSKLDICWPIGRWLRVDFSFVTIMDFFTRRNRWKWLNANFSVFEVFNAALAKKGRNGTPMVIRPYHLSILFVRYPIPLTKSVRTSTKGRSIARI